MSGRAASVTLVRPRHENFTRRGAFGTLMAAAMALAASLVTHPMVPARFLTPDDDLQVADAILVFSGDPDYERTLEAVHLYHLGYGRYLVFSGRGGPGDSAQSMAAVARLHGVPDQAILEDGRATNTYQNVLFVRELLARVHVRKLILVTSAYHQRRAYLVAHHVLRDVVLINHAAAQSRRTPREWWRDPAARATVAREYMKLAGYLVMGRI
jgi:uncharacterized SAM-binding protein YcdF (DUF218 family)